MSYSVRKNPNAWTHLNDSEFGESLALPRAAHNVNGEDPALMSCEQVIDEIANDRVGLVAELGHDSTNQRAAAAMPFQVDRAVNIVRAVNFCPTMRTPRLFCPHFDEAKLFLQFWIAHDLTAQRSATIRDHLDHGLHRSITLSKSD